MKTIRKKQKIGIWGFGIVGKSALRYFTSKNCTLEVLDKRNLTPNETSELKNLGISFLGPSELKSFLEHNDKILASPGIDLRPYVKYQSKWITELDILQKEFKRPIVAITGSVGKTTVTHLLSQLLQKQGLRVWTGGNIGTGMLDLLQADETVDLAVLEISSFQLEQCTLFAPEIAIWTSFAPNHIDRHGDIDQYFAAKSNILIRQKKKQCAIAPITIAEKINTIGCQQKLLYFFKGSLFPFFSCGEKPNAEGIFLTEYTRVMRRRPSEKVSNNTLYVLQASQLTQKKAAVNQQLTSIFEALPPITFQENRLILTLAVKKICSLFKKKISLKALKFDNLPPHRLEKIATINGVDFYNDSKATSPAATSAAVKQFSGRPILLMLGGLSKGIDRAPLIAEIKNRVKMVYAFGQEAKKIKKLCDQQEVNCHAFDDLQQAVDLCKQDAHPGDLVLLSPAGASFDLFNNYQERGSFFKQYVFKKTKI